MKELKNLFCAAALLCLALSGAAAKKNKKTSLPPKWLYSPYSVYDEATCLAAVGNGYDRTTAQAAAIRELSSVFGQTVASLTVAGSRMEQAQKDGIVACNKNSTIDQQTQLLVSHDDLIGIEIADVWEDSAKSRWYAVALMDRAKSAAIYASMIEKNNAQIKKLLPESPSKGAGYSLLDYARCDFAAEIAGKNEVYMNRLSVLDSERAGGLRPLTLLRQDLVIRCCEIASSIPVFVRQNQDSDGRINSAFSQVLHEFGFSTSKSKNARYTIDVNFYLSDVMPVKSADRISVNYTVDAFLTDNTNGEKLIPFNVNGRAQHVDEARAAEAALRSAEKKIKNSFGSKFTEYIKQLSLK